MVPKGIFKKFTSLVLVGRVPFPYNSLGCKGIPTGIVKKDHNA